MNIGVLAEQALARLYNEFENLPADGKQKYDDSTTLTVPSAASSAPPASQSGSSLLPKRKETCSPASKPAGNNKSEFDTGATAASTDDASPQPAPLTGQSSSSLPPTRKQTYSAAVETIGSSKSKREYNPRTVQNMLKKHSS